MNNKILSRLAAFNEILYKIQHWLFINYNTLTAEGNQFLEWLIPKYKQWIKNHSADIQDELFEFNIRSDDVDTYVNTYWNNEYDFANDAYQDIKQYLAEHIPIDIQELDKQKDRIIASETQILSDRQIGHDSDIKQLLVNLIADRLVQFNKITGKQYTEDSLSKKLSSLICGTIYIQLDKFVKRGVALSVRGRIYDVKQGAASALREICAESVITDEFCHDHFNCSLEQFNRFGKCVENVSDRAFISDTDWKELFDYFYDKVDQAVQDITSSARIERNKYLLELDNDDKIGQLYGEIDYDPHNTQFRDAPIVVYRDFSDGGKDKIIIGKYGEFHINCIKRVDPTIETKCQSELGTFLSECYFYKPCAFIDTTNGDYSIDEIAKILKADSRIRKVYLSPGRRGGKLKRLAKKFK